MSLWFVWDEVNQEHVAQHGVSKEESEKVFLHPEWTGRSRRSGRPVARGWTSTGKYLLCVYEMLDELQVYPITAYQVED
jgi:uncharacterized DUF497 family protein